MISAINYFKKIGSEKRTLNEVINEEIELYKTGRLFESENQYLYNSLYCLQITNFQNEFPGTKLHVLSFDSIFTGTEIKLKKFFEIIGIKKENNLNLRFNAYRNKNSQARFKILNKIFFSENKLKSKILSIIPPKIKTRLKWYILEKNITGKPFSQRISDSYISELDKILINEKILIDKIK